MDLIGIVISIPVCNFLIAQETSDAISLVETGAVIEPGICESGGVCDERFWMGPLYVFPRACFCGILESDWFLKGLETVVEAVHGWVLWAERESRLVTRSRHSLLP